MVVADARTAVTFSLSPGQAHDAPEGRKLLRRLARPGASPGGTTGRYTSGATRSSACSDGSRASGASFSRFEKLDALFLGFVHFALVYNAVR